MAIPTDVKSQVLQAYAQLTGKSPDQIDAEGLNYWMNRFNTLGYEGGFKELQTSAGGVANPYQDYLAQYAREGKDSPLDNTDIQAHPGMPASYSAIQNLVAKAKAMGAGNDTTGYQIPGVGLLKPQYSTSGTGGDGGYQKKTLIGYSTQIPGTQNQIVVGNGGGDTVSTRLATPGGYKDQAKLGAAALAAMASAGAFSGLGAGLGGSGLGGAGGYAGAAGDFGLLAPGVSNAAAASTASSAGLGSLGASSIPGLVTSGASSFAPTAATSGGGSWLSQLGSGIKSAGSSVMSALTGSPAAGTAATGGGGLLSNIASGLAKPGVLGAIGGLAGAIPASTTPAGSTTNTTAQQIDPRMAAILYGADGKSGILNQIAAGANTPQAGGNQAYGSAVNTFMQSPGFLKGIGDLYGSASGLANSNFTSPNIQNPNQNRLDLSKNYSAMLNGDPGDNPYLTGAIGKGINQSNVAFQQMLQDATRNLTQNVLPNIRGGAQSAGQYGGSRQGIAEGQGLTSFNQGIDRAISQANQGNTDAAVAARAGSYESGQNRNASLIAGLSGQQYGTAQNQAQLQGQTNQLNSANRLSGIAAQSGLMGNYLQQGQQQQNYGMGQAGTVAGILSPYSGLGGSRTESTPYYSNTAGNIMGGITAGLGLYNAFNGK
jgi:hypothetical protein